MIQNSSQECLSNVLKALAGDEQIPGSILEAKLSCSVLPKISLYNYRKSLNRGWPSMSYCRPERDSSNINFISIQTLRQQIDDNSR